MSHPNLQTAQARGHQSAARTTQVRSSDVEVVLDIWIGAAVAVLVVRDPVVQLHRLRRTASERTEKCSGGDAKPTKACHCCESQLLRLR